MAHDDLQFRVPVKDPVRDHSKDMQTDAVRKAQRRPDEPFPICPQLFVDCARGVARVQVEGYVQLGTGLPEYIPFGVVVEDHVVAVRAGALCVVHQGAFEAVFLDTAAELRGCLVGVMHG